MTKTKIVAREDFITLNLVCKRKLAADPCIRSTMILINDFLSCKSYKTTVTLADIAFLAILFF